MKRRFLLLFLAFALLLSGCVQMAPADTRIQVSLLAGEGYTVENNGQWVKPGDDAVFALTMAEGCSLSAVDYDGKYDHVVEDGKIILTLKDVAYPARVRVFTTTRYCTITYDPNGGCGKSTVKNYSLTYHPRPNTETGKGMFQRPGYTLVSWNTQPDGSGTRVGLGSRLTAGPEQMLYAQWVQWSPAENFRYTVTQFGNVTIDAYLGSDETVVIPEEIEGYDVTAVAARAFENSGVRHVVLPVNMDRVAPDAFANSALETVTLFDNIQVISDSSFEGCDSLRTLYINAIEAPYGYEFRKESVYADKVDKLILAQGRKKMVFYAGCSVWYNLNGADTYKAFDGEYEILNLGLNGTINSAVQMQILAHYLEERDVLVHTLELTSPYQLLNSVQMGNHDDKLWSGLEYNYDLFSLVDLRTVNGAFDSLVSYLEKKEAKSSYNDHYTDDDGNEYLDEYGCVPFLRDSTKEALADKVHLDPASITEEGMTRLENYYDWYQSKGVTVYVSYACVNMDEVPEAEQGNTGQMDTLVRDAVAAMGDVALISNLADFLYVHEDFYDTNYHLLTKQARENTAIWIRDLQVQMKADGLWEDAQ